MLFGKKRERFSLFWEPLKDNASLPLDVDWDQCWLQMRDLEMSHHQKTHSQPKSEASILEVSEPAE